METKNETLTKDDLKNTQEADGKPRQKSVEELEREIESLKAKNFDLEKAHGKDMAINREIIKDKRQPGILSYDQEGRALKKKEAKNPWGLSDLVLPPYVKGRVAVYRITGLDENNAATGLPVEAFPVWMPGRYTFHDRFEDNPTKKDKVISNITGFDRRIVNGETIQEEIVEEVFFDRGMCYVNIEKEYNKYVLMELHPNYKQNKYRDKNVPVRFERIDIMDKSKASLDATLDLGLQAAIEVAAMNKEDIYKYAAGVDEIISSSGRPLHEVRGDLKRWALNNPQLFYKLIPNSKAGVQIMVLDAINFGLLAYRVNGKKGKGYYLTETDELVTSHTAAQEPMDVLVKFLASKEGEAYKAALERSMQYWDVEEELN